MKIVIVVVALSLVLVGCGQSPTLPANTTESGNSTIQPEVAIGNPATKLDFFDAMENFAERFPTYGGYSIAPDGRRLTIFTTDNRSDQSRKIRDTLIETMEQSSGVPEASDAQGQPVQMRELPFTYERVRFSRRELNRWRGSVRTLLYSAGVNSLSITDASNSINVQVDNETKSVALLKFLRDQRMPREAVRVTVGVVALGKTLNDAFNPPVGGVNVTNAADTSECSLGLPVLVNNVASYLASSHCSATWGTTDSAAIFQGGTQIGTERFDNAFSACTINTTTNALCQAADTSIYTASGGFTRGRIIKTLGGTGNISTGTSDTYYDVTAVSERPAEGQVVTSIGATTGSRDATVFSADTDLAYTTLSPPRVIRRVVEVRRSSTSGIGAGCVGDSGGPWFQVTGASTAKFLGIYSGQTQDAPSIQRPNGPAGCGYAAYFTPVAQIRLAYPSVTFGFIR